MADNNLNFTRTLIYINVMYYILHCMTQLIRMHMYNTRIHDSSLYKVLVRTLRPDNV